MTNANRTDPRTYPDDTITRWRELLAAHYGVGVREVKVVQEGFYVYQIDPTKPFRTVVSFEDAMQIVDKA